MTQPSRACTRDQRPPRPRARSRLNPESGSRNIGISEFTLEIPEVIAEDTSVDETWAKQAEIVFENCASLAGIKWIREPHSYRQGFVHRGTVNVRPDYYLPELDISVEVTTGRTLHKLRRLQGAMQVAAGEGRDLEILLFDGPMMKRLSFGSVSIWDLIFRQLELLPDFGCQTRAA